MVLWQLALTVLAAGAGQPTPDAWLIQHAWEAADPAASPLTGSPVGDLLIYRRHLHAEVLQLLKDEQLSDIAKAECCRLLSILRVSDRESLAEIVAVAEWRPHLRTPTAQALISPTGQDPMLMRPGCTALRYVELPAAGVILAQPSTPRTRPLLAELLSYAGGGAAPAMANEAWGPSDDPAVNQALARYCGKWPNSGSTQYCLVVAGAERTDRPLGEVLSTEDFPTRLSVAQDLIRRQRVAEQWLAEALAAGNAHSAAWEARKGRPEGDPTHPDYAYIVQAWRTGEEPPMSLAPDERTACILALGEIRSRSMPLLQVLIEDLAFVPDSWPRKVGPAGFALARIGLPALQVLRYVHGDTPEFRRAKLEVVGLMLGRFAAEPFKKIKERGYDAWPGIDDDMAYLEREYAGAKGIYEYIPDEPPKAE